MSLLKHRVKCELKFNLKRICYKIDVLFFLDCVAIVVFLLSLTHPICVLTVFEQILISLKTFQNRVSFIGAKVVRGEKRVYSENMELNNLISFLLDTCTPKAIGLLLL